MDGSPPTRDGWRSTPGEGARLGATGHGRWGVAAVLGASAVVCWSVLAMLQVLILNPLAAMPGWTLAEIGDGVRAAGDSMGAPASVVMLGLPIVAALVVCCVFAAGRISVRQMVNSLLGVLAASGLIYLWASAGPAIAMADAFGISGGDHTGWGWMLPAVSAAALLMLIAGEVRWWRGSAVRIRRPGRPATAR